MIFLLLLRITYKPLDVSFLNSNSINLKGYIDNFENISKVDIIILCLPTPLNKSNA